MTPALGHTAQMLLRCWGLGVEGFGCFSSLSDIYIANSGWSLPSPVSTGTSSTVPLVKGKVSRDAQTWGCRTSTGVKCWTWKKWSRSAFVSPYSIQRVGRRKFRSSDGVTAMRRCLLKWLPILVCASLGSVPCLEMAKQHFP